MPYRLLLVLLISVGSLGLHRSSAAQSDATTRPSTEETVPTGILFETVEADGRSYDYAVYVPRDYDASKAWPVIVFLHGMGESGTDGANQLRIGLPPAILRKPQDWPAIVVIPQKPDTRSQWEDHEAAVMAALEKAKQDYNVDESRLYLTGLSQGGHGTMVLGARHADVWAAIAPVCGYCEPGPLAEKLVDMPTWVFHGDADPVVPVEQSKKFVEAIEAAGGHPKLMIYPGVSHNSWDKAYAEPGFAEWLFSQRK